MLDISKRIFFTASSKFSNFSLLGLINSSVISYSNSSESQDFKTGTSAEQLMFDYLATKTLLQNASLELKSSLSSVLNMYSNHAYWHRYFISFNLGFRRLFNPIISYSHKLANEGKSPFVYERQYAREDNEVGIQLTQSFYKFQLAYESAGSTLIIERGDYYNEK